MAETNMGFLWCMSISYCCCQENLREAKHLIPDIISRRVGLTRDVVTFENEGASLEIFSLQYCQIYTIEKCCVT